MCKFINGNAILKVFKTYLKLLFILFTRTYDEVVVKPGKHLNLIIGPNGTGKSTIVSAIVLGLGGSPSVIGRAPQIGHYVKSGQENATIEIDLQNGPNKFVTVSRSFNLRNNTTWMVNKKGATSKQISDLMRSFNIQVYRKFNLLFFNCFYF